jgi:hypothetical protein
VDLINKVFKSLKATFPAWQVAIKDPEIEAQARKEWLRGLLENGITSDLQIDAGLAKARAHNSPFLPSIGQFVEWCKSAAHDMAGLPSESDALQALIKEIARPKEMRQWANYHPSVFLAYTQRQSYDWKNYSYRDLKQAFSETWGDIKKMALSGFDFNLNLPKPEDVSAKATERLIDREVGAKKSAELLQMFGVDAEKTYAQNVNSVERLQQARKILEQQNATS